MQNEEKKGITVKVDADLHAEVKEYIEKNGMTMAEFVSIALQDELHPKFQNREENSMEKMRTMAFQVPESTFQKIKEFIQRKGISQKEFVLGLIERAIDQDQGETDDFKAVKTPDEDGVEEEQKMPVNVRYAGDFSDYSDEEEEEYAEETESEQDEEQDEELEEDEEISMCM